MAEKKKVKKLPSNDNIVPTNTTGTELEILQKIESAWRKHNPNEKGRLTATSLDWFRKYVVKSYNNVLNSTMVRDRKMWKNTMTLGKMYFYEYDPKHKDTLPIYDRYPLVFPFSTYNSKIDGMKIVVGLNMHYLRPELRKIAFTALLKLRTEKRYRKSTKLKIEWAMLKAMAENPLFQHAVHAYRMDHVRSVFVEIPAQSWELALFLPTARWVGDKNKLNIKYKTKK